MPKTGLGIRLDIVIDYYRNFVEDSYGKRLSRGCDKCMTRRTNILELRQKIRFRLFLVSFYM